MDLARAATANGGGECDLDHLVLPVVNGWSPQEGWLTLEVPNAPSEARRALVNPLADLLNRLQGIKALHPPGSACLGK